MLEPEAGAKELPPTENTSPEEPLATEDPEGPSPTPRTFVPMPPVCSDSTVHSEMVPHLSPEHPSDDAKSTESIFLTQVTVPRCLHPALAHSLSTPTPQCPQVPAAPELPALL